MSVCTGLPLLHVIPGFGAAGQSDRPARLPAVWHSLWTVSSTWKCFCLFCWHSLSSVYLCVLFLYNEQTDVWLRSPLKPNSFWTSWGHCVERYFSFKVAPPPGNFTKCISSFILSPAFLSILNVNLSPVQQIFFFFFIPDWPFTLHSPVHSRSTRQNKKLTTI